MPVEVQIMGAATQHRRTQPLIQAIRRHHEKIFHALGLADPEVSVVLTDDEEIRALNAQWRGTDEATDVLSFPIYEADQIPDDPLVLGDIIISLASAERMVESQEHHRRVAEEMGVDPDSFEWLLEDEVAFLYVHGLLHLVGHDHADPREEAEMRRLERLLFDLIRPPSSPANSPDGDHGNP